jgi:hypothetical protein
MRISGAVLLLAALGVRPADGSPAVRIGEVRRVESQTGTALRRGPAPLSPVVATLAPGRRVEVLDVHAGFACVEVAEGAGWVRAADLVDRTAFDATAVELLRIVGRSAEEDVRAKDAALDAAYDAVDRIERTKPTDAEVEAFVREGRLGR